MHKPQEPTNLEDTVERTSKLARVVTHAYAVMMLIAPIVMGFTSINDGNTVLGAILLFVSAAVFVVIEKDHKHIYGKHGVKWVSALRKAADTPSEWQEVEVWFYTNAQNENHRTQPIALIARPDEKPHLASTLLAGTGLGEKPGRAKLWGDIQKGGIAILEKDGKPLWPSRPSRGRLYVAMTQFAVFSSSRITGVKIER